MADASDQVPARFNDAKRGRAGNDAHGKERV